MMKQFRAVTTLAAIGLAALWNAAIAEEVAAEDTVTVDTSRTRMDETVCRRITPVYTNFAETVCYSRSRYQEMSRNAQDAYRDMTESGTEPFSADEVINVPVD